MKHIEAFVLGLAIVSGSVALVMITIWAITVFIDKFGGPAYFIMLGLISSYLLGRAFRKDGTFNS